MRSASAREHGVLVRRAADLGFKLGDVLLGALELLGEREVLVEQGLGFLRAVELDDGAQLFVLRAQGVALLRDAGELFAGVGELLLELGDAGFGLAARLLRGLIHGLHVGELAGEGVDDAVAGFAL